MKKIISILLAVTVLLTAFSACASEPEVTDLTRTLTPSAYSMQEEPDCSAILNFGLSMLKAQDPSENVLISPLSAYVALAMTANGAAGDTLTEFETVMGGNLQQINDRCALLSSALSSVDGGTTLRLADSAWINECFAVREAYLQTIVDAFDAEVFTADLTADATVDAVNQWVSEMTEGEIDKILEQPPEANTALILLNALYMDAKWETPFEPVDTREREFTCDSGEIVTCEFMNDDINKRFYLSGEGFMGTLLPYEDGRLAMALLLPDEEQSVTELIAALRGDQLLSAIENRQEVEMDLSLPKFEYETSMDLKNSLQQMGLETAFSMGADFSPMVESGNSELYIASVAQKCRILVEEKGTVASAATEIGIAEKAIPESKYVLNFNRPFVYLILDTVTNTPLFLGVMTDPTA